MNNQQELPVSEHKLQRSLTLNDAIAIVVGSMIGSGVFLKASAIAEILPNPWLILFVWLLSGLLTLGGALVMSELGAMMPEAGGIYLYLTRAYGPFIGFIFGWSLLAVLQTGSIAGMAAGSIQSLLVLNPGIEPYQTQLAGVLIIGLTIVNVISLKSSARLQNVLTVAKVIGIGLLAFGSLFLGGVNPENFTASKPQHALGLLGILSAIGLCMSKSLWAYDGWANLGFVTGELKEPQKNLPRAIGIGVTLVIIVYVIINATYHLVLPMAEVQSSQSVAVDVVKKLLGFQGTVVMSVLTFVSMAGALNSSVLSAPRVYYAMAIEGKFPKMLGAVHSTFKTPHIALIIQGIWSVVLLSHWGTFEALTDNVIFVFWIFYGMGAGAVIILRTKEPNAERPYKSLGYPWVPVVFIIAAVLLTVNTLTSSWRESSEALLLVFSGALLYPFFKGSKRTVN